MLRVDTHGPSRKKTGNVNGPIHRNNLPVICCLAPLLSALDTFVHHVYEFVTMHVFPGATTPVNDSGVQSWLLLDDLHDHPFHLLFPASFAHRLQLPRPCFVTMLCEVVLARGIPQDLHGCGVMLVYLVLRVIFRCEDKHCPVVPTVAAVVAGTKDGNATALVLFLETSPVLR